jgi:hypothetical protein
VCYRENKTIERRELVAYKIAIGKFH